MVTAVQKAWGIKANSNNNAHSNLECAFLWVAAAAAFSQNDRVTFVLDLGLPFLSTQVPGLTRGLRSPSPPSLNFGGIQPWWGTALPLRQLAGWIYILAGLNSARPPWHERAPPLAQAGVPTINTVTWVVSIGGGSCHYTINDHIVCPGDLRPGFRSPLLSRIHVSGGWVSTRLPWTCHRLAFSWYFELQCNRGRPHCGSGPRAASLP